MIRENDIVELYTDGSCRGNPGPGGWAVLMRCKGQEKTIDGGELETTNNRMELMAAIQGLEALTRPCQVILVTDSNYLKSGMTTWIKGWQAKGWKTADKQPVKNIDLWQRLITAAAPHRIEWRWVKAHAGNADNERVDALAKLAITKL